MFPAHKLIALVALSGLLVLGARTAEAQRQRRVYLNGVDLTDTEVTNQEFKSCKVRFDEHGNLYISAPGLDIKKQPAKKPPAAKQPARKRPAKKAADKGRAGARVEPGVLTKKYFLVSKESQRGRTGYDVSVYVNGRKVTTIRSNAEPAALDITRFVKPGKNKVRLFATKKKGARPARKDAKSAAHLELQVGEGSVREATVTLTKTLLQYRRTAAETATHDHTYRFTAR